MGKDRIPTTLDTFVARYIPSIETLEILLLLFASRERPWTALEVQNRIRSSVPSIIQNLQHLAASRLAVALENGTRFQYQSPSPELEAQIAALEDAYRTRRVTVIELIYRERTDPLRRFTDAFKIRRPHDR